MKLEANDPRLTAYALGELDSAATAELEAALAADPDARAAVEEIRTAGRLLTEALAAEPAPVLSGAQRRTIVTPPQPKGLLLRLRRWQPSRALTGLAVAAAAVILIINLFLNLNVAPVFFWLNQIQTSSGHDTAERASYDGTRITLGDVLRGETPEALPPDISVSATALAERIVATPIPVPGAAQIPRTAGALMGYDAAAAAPGEPVEGEPEDVFPMPGESEFNTEAYDRVVDNPFRAVKDEPLSTFSIDVDTASYANVRRFLAEGTLPPADAVRIEEMVNYFPYDYAPPAADAADPFAVHVAVAGAPWQPDHRLVRIGLKGREVDTTSRAAANLVFLVDVSGSMQDFNKLPLVQDALRLLIETLRPDDRVAMVVYAGSEGLVLRSTSGAEKQTLLRAVDKLQAGGSTNGGAGIQLAYRVAQEHLVDGGINRVILCTDGDFNVGVTDEGSLVRMIEEKAKGGVFLSVLGFGMGNYKDAMLEKLADKGNGNYGYIDTLAEARKVLVEQGTGTLITIAKDVKIQVEFNPATVTAYRLIGYENRVLANQDFNDDTKDAGEIGAGHTVTALYEVVPVGVALDVPGVDPLKYQQPPVLSDAAGSGELMTLKLRYKEPDGLFSKLLEYTVVDGGAGYESAPPDFQFAAAVAAFGMVLRDSPYRGEATLDLARSLAQAGLVNDPGDYRAEFVQMVQQARNLRSRLGTEPSRAP